MQVMKLIAVLLPKQRHPRIPVLPVQMSIIRPLLKRTAAEEGRRAGQRRKLRN
jgi:hypothetical protein